MNRGGTFGPELPGSFPTSAAEKQKSSTSDVCDCKRFENDHPCSPSFPQMLSDVQPRGAKFIITLGLLM